MAIYRAANVSYSAVNTAYGLCSAGDTLEIPAGSETWTDQTLSVTKAITIQGAGVGNTILTGSMSSYLTPMISFIPNPDGAARVTGIEFTYASNNPGAIAIQVGRGPTAGILQVRIDHNKFNKGSSTLLIVGRVEGVADHNSFINCNISVCFVGDQDESWSRTIEAGTSHSFFVEDNTFTYTNDADREPNEAIYHQEGCRSVVRYNTFDGSAYTGGQSFFYESHGNWGPPGTDPADDAAWDYRGQPILECYNNIFLLGWAYTLSGIRGGSLLMWGNRWTITTGDIPTLRLTEQESWDDYWFDPLRTVWPAKDQLTNTFFWDNLIKKTGEGWNTLVPVLQHANDATFIQENRDYFMHAPAASGGKSTYPGLPGDDDMTFSSEGPNAYYPYTPYTYPHPLRGAEEGFAYQLVMILKEGD